MLRHCGTASNEMKFGRVAKVPPGQRNADDVPEVDNDCAHKVDVSCCCYAVVNRPRISEPVWQRFQDPPHCGGIPLLNYFRGHDFHSHLLAGLPEAERSAGVSGVRSPSGMFHRSVNEIWPAVSGPYFTLKPNGA